MHPDHKYEKLQKQGKKVLEAIDAVFKDNGVVRAQMMIQIDDGVVIDHDFGVGVVDKLGLIEMARVNAHTRQANYIHNTIAMENKRMAEAATKSPILKPI